LSSIATERSNVILFPLPMDIVTPLLSKVSEAKESK
jgi:hypothetical protein